MAEVEVKITGLSELQAKLEAMPHILAERIIRGTLIRVGEELAIKLFENAPRSQDPRDSPGWLASHMESTFHSHGDDIAGEVRVGPTKTDYPRRGHRWRKQFKHSEAVEGSTISADSVARFLEFGTSRISANPFMSATWDEFKDTALTEIIADLEDAIELAAK